MEEKKLNMETMGKKTPEPTTTRKKLAKKEEVKDVPVEKASPVVNLANDIKQLKRQHTKELKKLTADFAKEKELLNATINQLAEQVNIANQESASMSETLRIKNRQVTEMKAIINDHYIMMNASLKSTAKNLEAIGVLGGQNE